jgi:hypothetical protein
MNEIDALKTLISIGGWLVVALFILVMLRIVLRPLEDYWRISRQMREDDRKAVEDESKARDEWSKRLWISGDKPNLLQEIERKESK